MVKLDGAIPRRWINYLAMGVVGATILTITAVLIVIAVWPPFNILSFLLPVGFVAVMTGIIFFVRSTDCNQKPDVKIDCKIE